MPMDSTARMYHEFEAAFEYEETEDQLKAIEDITHDMESSKPMDRLVCGDVGYGKTEVAMRAAFKAVEANRQVAVLVPTTLLAHQHYDNFSERFAPFPARVALLSRFQSPKEAKAILKDVASGTIDVVIGTHRLIQKDVVFRDLGLVIIDEEQWFGVKHKERLKQLRTQVDVLTLTATPIPRTLQMAMASVRDLSIIETPPAGRLSIRTQVVRSNDTLIREAILRELGRGGQVYFVHNRVETMEKTGAWLHQLVPDARIVMAHGQMNAKPLEAVMLKFFRREADVLIASAIIQSGIDVPHANTIFVNRADMFGLAQLYQLRGRVGRSGDQAYAYFLVPDEGRLSDDAQKRLTAIQQFTELGAGFRIAAADMEIRGAGNLLGKQQSGHIAAIGLDLYMQMVEQAVQRLKGQVVEEEPDPILRLNVSAFIPDDYVADPHQRLSCYKRLSSCTQVGDLALLHGEIQDRYGLAPDSVERLFEVMQIRLQAKALRLSTIELKDPLRRRHARRQEPGLKPGDSPDDGPVQETDVLPVSAVVRAPDAASRLAFHLSRTHRQSCKAWEAVIPTPRCRHTHLTDQISDAHDSNHRRIHERRHCPSRLPCSPAPSAASSSCLTGCAPPPEEGVLALVNGRQITQTDFDIHWGELAEATRARYLKEGGKRLFLDELITRELLMQEARKLGLDQSDAIRDRAQRYREQLIIDELLKDRIKAKVELTNEELNAFYEQHASELLPPLKVRVAQMLLPNISAAKDLEHQVNQGGRLRQVCAALFRRLQNESERRRSRTLSKRTGRPQKSMQSFIPSKPEWSVPRSKRTPAITSS